MGKYCSALVNMCMQIKEQIRNKLFNKQETSSVVEESLLLHTHSVPIRVRVCDHMCACVGLCTKQGRLNNFKQVFKLQLHFLCLAVKQKLSYKQGHHSNYI